MKSKPNSRKKGKKSKPAHDVELKPADYQPIEAELDEDLRLPASFDRMVGALFAGDKRVPN